MDRLRIRRRLEREERGASLVEFALVLPIFALLLFGLIDFGLVFGGFVTLRNDVGAAARNAAVDFIASSCTSATNPMLCTVQSNIGSLPGIVPGSIKVAISFPTGTASVGQPVLICAQATIHSTTGITSPFLNGRSIHASTEMRLEQTPSYLAGTSSTGFSC